jgi:hypothetical protein
VFWLDISTEHILNTSYLCTSFFGILCLIWFETIITVQTLLKKQKISQSIKMKYFHTCSLCRQLVDNYSVTII